MNPISPFGRLSRVPYAVTALSLLLIILAIGRFAPLVMPKLDGSLPAGEIVHTAWFYWTTGLGLFVLVLSWCLFCVCAKRLHDIGWTALPALLLFAPWLKAILATTLLPMLAVHLRLSSPDLNTVYHYIYWSTLGLRYLSWLMVVVLCFVPGRHTMTPPDAVAATA